MLHSSKMLSMRGSQSSGARSLAGRTPCGSQSSDKRSLELDLERGSQSSGMRSRAGTTTSALHETVRGGCRQTSTCVLLLRLTVWEGLCRGLSSGPEGRTEKRR